MIGEECLYLRKFCVMNLKDFVAISSMPGLYRLVATRSNGLLVQEMDSEKTKFASTRKHQFTPLETVAIYTDSDSTELTEIFQRMEDNLKDLPLPASNASKEDFFSYFSEIVPDYDEERVMISDVKKVVKWFKFLNDRNLLIKEEKPKEEEAKVEVAKEKAEKKPAKKSKAPAKKPKTPKKKKES